MIRNETTAHSESQEIEIEVVELDDCNVTTVATDSGNTKKDKMSAHAASEKDENQLSCPIFSSQTRKNQTQSLSSMMQMSPVTDTYTLKTVVL